MPARRTPRVAPFGFHSLFSVSGRQRLEAFVSSLMRSSPSGVPQCQMGDQPSPTCSLSSS